MSKKEEIIVIILAILLMSFRLAAIIFSADEKLFIAIFEGLTAVISLYVLFLLAIQLKNSFDQTDLQLKQEKRNQTAIIKLRTIYTSEYIYFSLFNLGLSPAYDINIKIKKTMKTIKKEIDYIQVLEPRGTNIPDDEKTAKASIFKNEIIRDGESITAVIQRDSAISYDISLTYKDISSDELLSTELSFSFD